MLFIISKLIDRFLIPSNIVLMLALIGIVLLALGWRRLGRGALVLSVLLLGIGGMTPAGNIALAMLEDRFPTPGLATPPTGIIMLGGAVDLHLTSSRNTITFNDAGERLTETAILANRFKQARIFLSGGAGHVDPSGPVTESSIARDLLVKLEIPADRIAMEQKSRTTYENALYSAEVLQPKPGETWLLVTSASHMPRAVAAFRAARFNVIPYPVDFRTHGLADPWQMPKSVADGFENLDLAAHEWIGLVTYRLTGRTAALFPAP